MTKVLFVLCNKKTACDYFNGKHHSGISLWQQQISPDYASGKLKRIVSYSKAIWPDINQVGRTLIKRETLEHVVSVNPLAVVSVHILQLAFNKRVTHHMNSFTLVLNLSTGAREGDEKIGDTLRLT